MARLVSYTSKDENRYCTFKNESVVIPSYKESELFKRVELARKARRIKSKKPVCVRCFTLTFWRKLCSCCCCGCFSRCRNKSCCFCCCYSQDIEGDTINEDGIVINTISCTSANDVQMSEINVNNVNGSDRGKSKSNKKASSKYWNWNDSLRSNSDKFLETLEYDLDGDRSLRKNRSHRTSSKIPLYSGKMKTSSTFSNVYHFIILKIGVQ